MAMEPGGSLAAEAIDAGARGPAAGEARTSAGRRPWRGGDVGSLEDKIAHGLGLADGSDSQDDDVSWLLPEADAEEQGGT
ncbi:unnamed protein product [Urochloa humidicola]